MSRPATTRLKVNPPLGVLPALQYLLPQQLEIDPAYQRTLEAAASQTLVRQIAMFWNWDLCQPLVVARRDDGRLYVIDGQHRLEAARMRGDIHQLPAVVVQYASVADEAASFVNLNQRRRPLNRLQIYRAALASGDDEARKIQAALEVVGLRIGTSPDVMIQKPGTIVCLPSLEKCLRVHGEKALAASLRVMADSYPGEKLRYAGTIFPGIMAVVADMSIRDDAALALLARMVGSKQQTEWYALANAKTAEYPTRLNAVAALFRERWAALQKRIPPPAPAPTPIVAAPARIPVAAAPKDNRRWCEQCEQRVSLTAASFCKNRFCKVRPALSARA